MIHKYSKYLNPKPTKIIHPPPVEFDSVNWLY